MLRIGPREAILEKIMKYINISIVLLFFSGITSGCLPMSVPEKSGTGNPMVILFMIGPQLAYRRSSYVFYSDTAIKPITPAVAGPSIYCTSNIPLPAGLTLDPSSCVISGTPTTTTSVINYAINGNNSFGTVSANIAIRIGNTTAVAVYGQGGSFISGTANYGGISANSLSVPFGLAFDSADGLYIADYQNNRVLYYPADSTIATRVYGQGGSFSTGTANNGGISADSLNSPHDVAVDSTGAIYISDSQNRRVLYFPSGSTTATRVYGQGGSFATANLNNGGISENSLSNVLGITLDSKNSLYVVDAYDNNRVLFFPPGSTTATRVYGQSGSFSTSDFNNGGISANSLYNQWKVALDLTGGIYLTDTRNNRVLFYPMGGTTATRVYGQSGSFSAGNINNGGAVSASSLYYPQGIQVDEIGALYVADHNNSRVLYFPAGSTTATRVYGQSGSFTSNVSNNGGISASSLNSGVDGIAIDSSGALYVVDLGNNRVLKY